MKLYKDGITMTVTSPSEIQRYKGAGYEEVKEETVEEVKEETTGRGRKTPPVEPPTGEQ